METMTSHSHDADEVAFNPRLLTEFFRKSPLFGNEGRTYYHCEDRFKQLSHCVAPSVGTFPSEVDYGTICGSLCKRYTPASTI
eukprot:9294330-Karenia_brevis.AAC.1